MLYMSGTHYYCKNEQLVQLNLATSVSCLISIHQDLPSALLCHYQPLNVPENGIVLFTLIYSQWDSLMLNDDAEKRHETEI